MTGLGAISAPPEHRHEVRVYYEDTDLAGVVYHANYLRFFERGRTEMLRACGVDQSALKARTGCVFLVAAMDLRFRSPARFDDLCAVLTAVERVGAASVRLEQRLVRVSEDAAAEAGGPSLVSASVTVALVGPEGRPQRLDGALRVALSG